MFSVGVGETGETLVAAAPDMMLIRRKKFDFCACGDVGDTGPPAETDDDAGDGASSCDGGAPVKRKAGSEIGFSAVTGATTAGTNGGAEAADAGDTGGGECADADDAADAVGCRRKRTGAGKYGTTAIRGRGSSSSASSSVSVDSSPSSIDNSEMPASAAALCAAMARRNSALTSKMTLS